MTQWFISNSPEVETKLYRRRLDAVIHLVNDLESDMAASRLILYSKSKDTVTEYSKTKGKFFHMYILFLTSSVLKNNCKKLYSDYGKILEEFVYGKVINTCSLDYISARRRFSYHCSVIGSPSSPPYLYGTYNPHILNSIYYVLEYIKGGTKMNNGALDNMGLILMSSLIREFPFKTVKAKNESLQFLNSLLSRGIKNDLFTVH